MTNTPVLPSLTTYDFHPGTRYRLFGLVRGTTTDDKVSAAIDAAGFDPSSATYYGAGTALPADWPDETPVPTSADERPFRFEGLYTSSSAMPTAVELGPTPSDVAIAYQAWAVDTGVARAGYEGGTPAPIAATDKGKLALGLALVAVGLLGGAFVLWEERRRAAGGARSTNPIRYETTLHHRGVVIHVHHDTTTDMYQADYRALDKYVPGKGGVEVGSTRGEAIAAAARAIDRAWSVSRAA